MNIILVHEIVKKILHIRSAAFTAALFYVSREAHFYNNYWISAGFQHGVMTFFVLSTIFFYIVFIQREKKLYYIASFVCGMLALISHVQALILPLLVFLVSFMCQNHKNQLSLQKVLYKTLPFCLIELPFILRLLYLVEFHSSSKLMFSLYKFYKFDFSINRLFINMAWYINETFNSSLELVLCSTLILFTLFFSNAKRKAFCSLIWFLVGTMTFIFSMEHFFGYFLSLSLVGLSISVTLGVISLYEKIKVSKNIVIISLCAFLTINSYIECRSTLRQVIDREREVRSFYSYLGENFSSFPPKSLLYIKNCGMDTLWLIGHKYGIKLYYGDAIEIFFLGVTKKIPAGCKEIYYFNYHGKKLKFLRKTIEKDGDL